MSLFANYKVYGLVYFYHFLFFFKEKYPYVFKDGTSIVVLHR